MKLKFLLTSRKFWAAVIGLLLIIVKPFWPDFPLDVDMIVQPLVDIIGVAVVIASYIMGTAVEDAARNSAKK
jgi:hypothetical protein